MELSFKGFSRDSRDFLIDRKELYIDRLIIVDFVKLYFIDASLFQLIIVENIIAKR